ncbi:MAG: hypothetical protein M0Z36_01100, partial [Thermaerobacter sp.]|nr:hypothetical protein [Thermaerobacter sp.]
VASTALAEEVYRLAEDGPDPEEVEHTRTALYTMAVMAQETPDARVMRIGRYALDQRRPPALTELRDEMAAVDAKAVMTLAESWTNWDRMAVAWAGPVDDSIDIIRHLQRSAGHA